MELKRSRKLLTRGTLFSGRFGLRAGWGVLIYMLLFAAFLAGITLIALAKTGHLKDGIAALGAPKATATHGPNNGLNKKPPSPDLGLEPNATISNELAAFLALALTTWILSRIERRRIGTYGISTRRWRDIFPGAFWGLASISVLVGMLRSMHFLVFDSRALQGAPILVNAAEWLLGFLFVGLLEEYLMRGYMQYSLTRGAYGLAERISSTHPRAIAFWIAATLMSFVFALAHQGSSGENVLGLGSVFAVGLVFSYALWRTGSLWWAIGFHMVWDWGESFLYGVPDSGHLSVGRLFNTHPIGDPTWSGGIDGPEGSILIIPTLAFIAIIIRLTTRRGSQPAFEPTVKSLVP